MRRMLMLIAALVTIVVGLCAGASGAEASWSVGYGEAEITPAPRQVQMSGYGRERYAKGVLAPLMTQAVAMRDSEGRTGVLVSADVLGYDRTTVDAIRNKIGRKHGIAAENVMLSASHTHWGPAIRFSVSYSIGGPNVWYMGLMEEKILGCVDAAIENLSSASIEYGWMDFREIGCNRRRPTDTGVGWGPNREGSFDGHTPILRIKREAGPRRLIVVGHACHPTSSGTIEKWSPDYPGAMRDCITGKLSETKAVFVQGCGGDAKIVYEDEKGKLVFCSDPDHARQAGVKLGEAVLKRLEEGRMIRLAGKLGCSLASGRISYGERWPREEMERQAYEGSTKSWPTWAARQALAMPDESESFRYDVQVWKLGGRLTIFGMEGEICSPWGPRLRALAGTEDAMVIGYANSTGS